MTTVLIVDDGGVDRKIAGSFVEREGMTAIYAQHGLEALEVLGRNPPDLVLTDLQMPEMDGLALVKAVRESYPTIPVMLMTAFGSEQTAVMALQEGAASYVPKVNLNNELGPALRVVLESAKLAEGRQKVNQILRRKDSEFVLDRSTWSCASALVHHLQEDLKDLRFFDDTELIRVGTALTEALANAIDHGCLELDSELREQENDAYRSLANERSELSPYCDRCVHLSAKVSRDEAVYIVRDDGPGFDPDDLPDPTDPENLLKASGRGVLLIRTFMSEVRFNDKGNEITMIKRCKLG